MKRSEIRELLKLIQKPEIISFAGGLPNPQAFPVESTRKIINQLLDESGEKVLQYGSTEGLNPLRDELAKRMSERGMDVERDDILITHGSQQALDLLSKVLLDPDDTIIVGSPTYLGATGAFRAFEADMESVKVREDGMDLDLLRQKIEELISEGDKPKFIYVVLTFQNPSGATMSAEKRHELLEIASEYDLLIVEDSPYSYLRYEGEKKPHLMSIDDDDHVLRLETFSKILAPGFRIAWATGPEELIEKMVIAKQATDLCTNPFGQFVAYEYLSQGIMDDHLEEIKDLYNKKRLTMLDAMEEHFPEEATWTRPNGGMFIWAELPESIDTREMLDKAVEENVAYVVGDAFFVEDDGHNTMRLNFTHSTKENIKKGIKKLGKVIKEELEASKHKKPSGKQEEGPISP